MVDENNELLARNRNMQNEVQKLITNLSQITLLNETLERDNLIL